MYAPESSALICFFGTIDTDELGKLVETANKTESLPMREICRYLKSPKQTTIGYSPISSKIALKAGFKTVPWLAPLNS